MSNYRIILSGDCHGDFSKFDSLCRKFPNENFTFVILGDCGLNYSLNRNDDNLKKFVSKLPATFICLRGNHDANHQKLDKYHQIIRNKGIMYVEDLYPNIFFMKDGEVYEFNGKKFFVCGGAYSVDKYYRICNRMKWFVDEQPQPEDKKYAWRRLADNGYCVDYILTHTCPTSAIPTHAFLPGIEQSLVDTSTEDFLEEIRKCTTFEKWFCGHWHLDEEYNGINFLFDNFFDVTHLFPVE